MRHFLEMQGNNLVDKVAEEAALHPETPMPHLTSVVQTTFLTPVFIPQEKAQLRKLGAS
jgi:hypothetical protein